MFASVMRTLSNAAKDKVLPNAEKDPELQNLCVICCERAADYLVIPCGHQVRARALKFISRVNVPCEAVFL